ncbi:MAG: patatin-like phospholipase family protein, partial [Burkholderiales bacterium]|nr:patatin-like phospholipase family protein [Burkholderiales bacterium]
MYSQSKSLFRACAVAVSCAVLLLACSTPRPQEPVLPLVVKQEVKPELIVPKVIRAPRIGLALGGGAARGFAHIGVIKVLEAHGINPDLVVGTSAGSVVAAMYAAGNNGYTLQKMALDMDEGTISDWSLPFFSKSSGVLKGEALQNYVN